MKSLPTILSAPAHRGWPRALALAAALALWLARPAEPVFLYFEADALLVRAPAPNGRPSPTPTEDEVRVELGEAAAPPGAPHRERAARPPAWRSPRYSSPRRVPA